MKRLVLVALALGGLAACKKKDVGLPCAISYGIDAGVQCNGPSNRCTGGAQTCAVHCDQPHAKVSTTSRLVPALECPAGICLSVEGQPGSSASLCSARCSDDSDCEGETSECLDDQGRESSFVCVKPFAVDVPDSLDPAMNNPNDHCKLKLCVCKPYAQAAHLLVDCPNHDQVPKEPMGCTANDDGVGDGSECQGHGQQ